MVAYNMIETCRPSSDARTASKRNEWRRQKEKEHGQGVKAIWTAPETLIHPIINADHSNSATPKPIGNENKNMMEILLMLVSILRQIKCKKRASMEVVEGSES